MNNEAIIRVEDPGKKYSLRDQRYTALRDVISEKAKNLFRRNGGTPGSQLQAPSASREDFWCLAGRKLFGSPRRSARHSRSQSRRQISRI